MALRGPGHTGPADTEGRVSAVEAGEASPPGRVGVLVVEDDDLVRRVVEMGLRQSEFDVWSALDGREAIELYRREREHVDVVLLDVRMPGLDGPEILDALRELN